MLNTNCVQCGEELGETTVNVHFILGSKELDDNTYIRQRFCWNPSCPNYALAQAMYLPEPKESKDTIGDVFKKYGVKLPKGVNPNTDVVEYLEDKYPSLARMIDGKKSCMHGIVAGTPCKKCAKMLKESHSKAF